MILKLKMDVIFAKSQKSFSEQIESPFYLLLKITLITEM